MQIDASDLFWVAIFIEEYESGKKTLLWTYQWIIQKIIKALSHNLQRDTCCQIWELEI